MHLFLEIVVVVAFLAAMTHAVLRYGTQLGLGYALCLTWLGFAREGFVVLSDFLYDFAPLDLELGPLPLISALIWGVSIHAAVVFAETVTGESLAESCAPRHAGGRFALLPSGGFLVCVAIFLEALACFFEPFLKLVGMASWEAGTRTTLDVPWIALVGYPTMAVIFLSIFTATWRGAAGRQAARAPGLPAPMGRLPLSLAIRVGFAGVGHAWALERLKQALGW